MGERERAAFILAVGIVIAAVVLAIGIANIHSTDTPRRQGTSASPNSEAAKPSKQPPDSK
jgi:hypothetical protein